MERQHPKAIVLMGVSGSGKSTTGRALAMEIGWSYYDADDFHSPENVAKMSAGQHLTDEDRQPWLATLNELLAAAINRGEPIVLACSALKRAYRDILRAGNEGVCFIFLRGDFDLIAHRMRERDDHYMTEALLRSQFADLEEPERALVVDVDRPVAEIVRYITKRLVLENNY